MPCSYDMCIFHILSLAKNVLNDIDVGTLLVKAHNKRVKFKKLATSLKFVNKVFME